MSPKILIIDQLGYWLLNTMSLFSQPPSYPYCISTIAFAIYTARLGPSCNSLYSELLLNGYYYVYSIMSIVFPIV